MCVKMTLNMNREYTDINKHRQLLILFLMCKHLSCPHSCSQRCEQTPPSYKEINFVQLVVCCIDLLICNWIFNHQWITSAIKQTLIIMFMYGHFVVLCILARTGYLQGVLWPHRSSLIRMWLCMYVYFLKSFFFLFFGGANYFEVIKM